MSENILDMVKRVALLRSEAGESSKRKKDLFLAWEVEHSQLLLHLAKTTFELAEAETALRAEAIKVYQETGSKEPGPGIQIREITKLVYAPEQALAWAIDHKVALALDTKLFEKIARASPIEGVVAKQVIPQATIAQDLEAVLKE